MAENGAYVTDPNGVRVWAPAPKKRKSRAKGGAPGQPPRPVLSEAERLERAQLQRDRLDVRRREVEALETLAGPALKVEWDRPVEHERIVSLDARTSASRELAKIDRAVVGSTMRVHARTYDGCMGGRPKFYALLSVWFRTPSGSPYRSKGCAIEGTELRAVGEALLALAGEYEAALAAGVEPWAQPDSSWKPLPAPPEAVPVESAAESGDCPDCGGELPDGHLDGCGRSGETRPEPVKLPPSKPPRKGARPYVVATCYDKVAETVAANMTREGHVAAIEGQNVRIGPMADGATADALAYRLTRASLHSHVEWASP